MFAGAGCVTLGFHAPMSEDQSHETSGTRHMDEALCGRMRAAIAAGLENAPIGVVTTPGTKKLKYIGRYCPRLAPWTFSLIPARAAALAHACGSDRYLSRLPSRDHNHRFACSFSALAVSNDGSPFPAALDCR
jgi:hypothetical protein